MMNDARKVMKDTEYRKALLQFLTAASICFMACKLFIAPDLVQLEQQKQQRELLQRELMQYQEFAASHQDYEEFFRRQTMRLEQLQRRLPAKVACSELLPLWQQQAQSCGVKLSDIRVLPLTEADNTISVQPIRITLSGSYYAALKFVQQLEKSENFVNLTKVDITGDANKGDIKLTAVLNIYLYGNDR